MALRPREKDTTAAAADGDAAPVAALKGRPCGGLARVLARAFREGKPEILVLGPLCGESVVYLAGRGARVHVEDFEPPPPVPVRRPGEPPPEVAPVRLDQPDALFHLVLAWEAADFVPPDRLAEVGGEFRRILRDGGGLFLFSHGRPEAEDERLSRYVLLADDLISREMIGRDRRQRYVHPTRDLERALKGFAIQGIQLQRTQMREITALKSETG
ncbi:MAG: class I SAM-dependent methyltransferase [Acidobacteriia bacterium]|nr:class I SAM-dependent methyltransferase [Terriglobia bacterium]